MTLAPSLPEIVSLPPELVTFIGASPDKTSPETPLPMVTAMFCDDKSPTIVMSFFVTVTISSL